MDESRILSARVSEDVYDAWHGWAAERGVTFTAVMQAVGEGLIATGGKFQQERDFIRRARQIDRERRQRPTLRRRSGGAA